MLEIQARDAAARLGIAEIGPRRLEFPNLLWIDEELGSAESQWEPLLSRRDNPDSVVINPGAIHRPRPTARPGQLLLRRELEPPPTLLAPRIHLLEIGERLRVFSGALALFRNPKRFAPALAEARKLAGYNRLLYAPGLGEPAHLALLAYAGIDLFDGVPLSLAAARGEYLTSHGAHPAEGLTSPECACPACQFEAPKGFTEEELRRHNQYAARAELGVVRNAIRGGRLRELVEGRVRVHPELTALLRRLDAQYEYLEERVPITRRTPLFATTKESLQRPEVARFRRRVQDRYQPKVEAAFLLLLPCSHRKPYSTSRTHRAFGDAIWGAGAATLVHEVILTSPLGLVPRELELTYPAAHYDVPVTGEWDEEEGTMIRGLLTGLLAKRRHDRVISHLPRHTRELVADLLPPDTLITCEGEDATKPQEMERLALVLGTLAKDRKPRSMGQVLRERLWGLATYQFGPEPAERLLAGATLQGKWPTGKLFHEGTQLAMLPTERGLLSLTIEGARRIAPAGQYLVQIEDFPVRGSIFAVGVTDADPQIRIGDEVVVVHGSEVRGVGTAAMTGPEMRESEHGEAVKVRHHA